MQDFGTLQQPLLGELAMSRKKERKREREKMPFIVATYVSVCSQGQRTHSARTKNTSLESYKRMHGFSLQESGAIRKKNRNSIMMNKVINKFIEFQPNLTTHNLSKQRTPQKVIKCQL